MNPLLERPQTLDEFLERFVFVVEGGRVADLAMPAHCSVMTEAEFHRAYVGPVVEHAGLRDRRVKTPMTKVWMNDPTRMMVRDLRYLPHGDRILAVGSLEYLNTFYFPEWEQTDAEDRLDVYHEHINFIFPQEDRRALFEDWLAHMVQEPEVRPKFTPLLIATKHGLGRGWLTEMISELVGGWNASESDMKQLAGEGNAGQYHDYLYQSLFCPVHETRATEKKYEVDDKVRSKLTEVFLQLNLKYGKNGRHQIHTRFLMMSNHLDALAIPAEDRRIWVHETKAEPRSADYYGSLYRWLQDTENLRQLWWYLQRRDLSRFNPGMRAPETPEKLRMGEVVRSELDVALENFIESIPAWLNVATMKQLRQLADARGGDVSEFFGRSSTLSRQIEQMMKKEYRTFQSTKGDGRLKFKGENVRVWLLRDESAWDDKDNDDVRAGLDQMQTYIEEVVAAKYIRPAPVANWGGR